ncbi:MAG: hypothetical protein V1934_01795 [Methanobacteriota archaeon]
MKLVHFRERRTYSIGEYDLARMNGELRADAKRPLKGPYELLRGDDFVVYQDNRRTRFSRELLVRRAATLLASISGNDAKMRGMDVAAGGHRFRFVPSLADEGELEYYEGTHGAQVIALARTPLAPSFRLDMKALDEFYKNYRFPPFFAPFVKMRHFRFQALDGTFRFQSRRYSDSKHSPSSKLVFDLGRPGNVAKCYVSLARMLDPRMEARGRGRPLDRMLAIFDIDADKDHSEHLIGADGVCSKCFKNARSKADKALGEFPVARLLFSGTKGFHLHLDKEVSAAEYLATAEALNEISAIVDDFSFERIGTRCLDMHRIIKVPSTVDAATGCLIAEGVTRIALADSFTSNPF